VAAEKNHVKVAKVLLEKGSDADIKRNDGCTPLYQAAYFDYEDMARLLVDYNATKNVCCKSC
jgi:ankyrin repeat protein